MSAPDFLPDRRFERAIRRWSEIGRPNQVPIWTPEDEANLRKRVARIAAKGTTNAR